MGAAPPSPPDGPGPVPSREGSGEPERQGRGILRGILELVIIMIAAGVFAYSLQAFIVKPFQIPSESMQPTIDPGDRILVNRLAYRFGSIQRGDIIVFKAPMDPNTDFVKRVIGLPGDRVEVKRGQLIINGVPQVEPYLHSIDLSNFPEQTVPQGDLFVMGDNRSNSDDSRYWKPPWLPINNVVGKAFMTYWPPGRFGLL